VLVLDVSSVRFLKHIKHLSVVKFSFHTVITCFLFLLQVYLLHWLCVLMYLEGSKIVISTAPSLGIHLAWS